jgi:MYXO-CTERM domain-containing protein
VAIYVLDVRLPRVLIPTASTPPPGVTFPGGVFGGSCSGNVYIAAGPGYAFCDDGKWAYTPTDPSADGFTPLSPDGGTGSGGGTGTGSGGGGGGDPGDAGVLTFEDGSVVVDGEAAQEPQPIDDGGPLVDGEVPNTPGANADGGSYFGDGSDYGASDAPQNWSSGCSVSHGEGSQDPTWLLLVAAGVVVSSQGRRRRRSV